MTAFAPRRFRADCGYRPIPLKMVSRQHRESLQSHATSDIRRAACYRPGRANRPHNIRGRSAPAILVLPHRCRLGALLVHKQYRLIRLKAPETLPSIHCRARTGGHRKASTHRIVVKDRRIGTSKVRLGHHLVQRDGDRGPMATIRRRKNAPLAQGRSHPRLYG